MNEKMVALKRRLAEIADLSHAMAMLSWDQETYMPPGAAQVRAEQLATMSKLAHEMFVADETGMLLESLAPTMAEMDPGDDDAAIYRLTKRDFDKARKLPTRLVTALSRATSLGVEAWKGARADNDFNAFEPYLREVVDLLVEKAQTLGYEEHIYDALLDEYEPGMKSATVATVFKQVKEATVPLVRAIVDNLDAVNNDILYQTFPTDKQWDFGMSVIRDFGFDFNRGRQDYSAHPFTTSFSHYDVRLTTRTDQNFFNTAFFGTLHETGHGLYEQGFSDSLLRTGVDGGASLGIHESQSRMWENLIGRSKPFWYHYYPKLQAQFPDQLRFTTFENFYRAVNKVTPSLIRVEADEVTYNLHIFLRFEIERELLAGLIDVADLPEVWNDRMQSMLGVTPDTDANGVMQDIHWGTGLIGYFPTYALGNIISVQFFNTLLGEQPGISDEIANGEFGTVLGWLRQNIHQHGRKYDPDQLLERITGGGLNPTPYIDYITLKYQEIYNL